MENGRGLFLPSQTFYSSLLTPIRLAFFLIFSRDIEVRRGKVYLFSLLSVPLKNIWGTKWNLRIFDLVRNC